MTDHELHISRERILPKVDNNQVLLPYEEELIDAFADWINRNILCRIFGEDRCNRWAEANASMEEADLQKDWESIRQLGILIKTLPSRIKNRFQKINLPKTTA